MEHTVVTFDPKRTKGYSKPYDTVFNKKTQGRGVGGWLGGRYGFS